MRCIACNRPLLAFAVSVQTRRGLIGWGPKCAKAADVLPKLKRDRVEVRRDLATRDWVQEAAA